MNKINGRTPEEIKKGLECFIESTGGRCLKPYIYCRECPKHIPGYMVEDKWKNALAYIQQLEAERDELLQKNQQLERERDAAVKDLRSVVASNYFNGDYCKICKYKEPDGECYHHCIPYSSEWGWEWRGVQKEVG